MNVRENRHPVGEVEGCIPALRRYARGLIGHGCPDPVASADDMVRQVIQRARRADPAPQINPRLWLFASLTSLNRARLRAASFRNISVATHPGGVREALADAPLDCREALLLVVVEGFSYAHAARILGVSRLAVANRLARARQLLNGPLEAAICGPTRSKLAHPPYLRLVK